MPHANRISPSCFGFLYFPDHVQPLQGGHVTKHRSSPVHRSSPTDLSGDLKDLEDPDSFYGKARCSFMLGALKT